MPTWFLVLASCGLVAVVLWFMFRLPASGTGLYPWAPPLALASVWFGVAAAVLAAVLWLVAHADYWVALALLVVDPAALTAGVMVLWIYRRDAGVEETVVLQRLQARVGIVLAMVAVAMGYVFVMTHKMPFTPVGQ